MQQHHLVILGAGWSSNFLIPLLRARKLPFAATTRDGHSVADTPTTAWTFDPSEPDSTQAEKNQFSRLPLAKNVLITFPLTGEGQSKKIVEGYQRAHANKLDGAEVHFVQYGSSGIWQIEQKTIWQSRRSPYNHDSPRAIAEDELLELGGCVMNLAGLWGSERQPRNWVGRVAKSKEDVKGKKSLHLVHGLDVARGMLAILDDWKEVGKGQRWMVTDGVVYDWWSLMVGWADAEEEGDDRRPSDFASWVFELMKEEKVHALPRSMEMLGRCYFGREFWDSVGLTPLKARI